MLIVFSHFCKQFSNFNLFSSKIPSILKIDTNSSFTYQSIKSQHILSLTFSSIIIHSRLMLVIQTLQIEEMIHPQNIDFQQQRESLLSYKIKKIKGFKLSVHTLSLSRLNNTENKTLLTRKKNKLSPKNQMENSLLKTSVNFGEVINTNNTIRNDQITKASIIQEDSTVIQKSIMTQSNKKTFKRLKENQSPTSKSRSKIKKSKKKLSQEHKVTFKFFKKSNQNGLRGNIVYESLAVKLDDINGEGTIITSNGKIIEGNFCQGIPIGQVKMIFENRVVYIGPVYDCLPHGKGIMQYPDGQKYEGQFCYGQPHGQGEFFDRGGELKLQGEWRRGKFYR